MSEYDALTAHFYAAYRPPLHAALLARVLSGRLGRGLDIGCGTGHSTRALAAYCEHVVGVDPSPEMLRVAGSTPGIRYQHLEGDLLPFPDAQFDAITFGGSLYYARSERLFGEVMRVGKQGARVIVYDFDVHLEGFYRLISEDGEELPPVAYDHRADFSVFLNADLQQTHSVEDTEEFSLDFTELACLMLSDRRILRRLVDRLGTEDLPLQLASLLRASLGERFTAISVPAKTYLTAYRIGG